MTITPENFDFIRSLLSEQTAMMLDESKEYLVEARLRPLAREYGDTDINGLLDRVRGNAGSGPPCRELVEAMAIHETFFFRDPGFHGALETLLGELAGRRNSNPALRIWSAACSTGQEPYSVALMLRQSFPELVARGTELLASDFSRTALRKAREGRYSMAEVNRGLPARMLTDWFHQEGLDWCLRDDIRRMVRFREINLVAPWPELPVFDIILLRNVLIYFGSSARDAVLSRLRRHLADDGYLILGATETLDQRHGFRRVSAASGIPCYQPCGGAR